MFLLNKAAATGSAVQWTGGKFLLAVAGTVGGASLQLQYLGPDNTTWLPVGSAITDVGTVVLELPPGMVRMAVTGGDPSGLYARMFIISRS